MRLFEVLCDRQRSDGCGNCVGQFIHIAMDPVRYSGSREMFYSRREELNRIPIFSGYSLGEDGKLCHRRAAKTLDDADEPAERMCGELSRRGVHPVVPKICRAELIRNYYFHAVLEATKSVAEKIKQRSGLTKDGGPLVADAFALGKTGIPRLAFNSPRTDNERNELNGMINLMRGMFSAFRNPTAHAAKLPWTITEQDASNLLTLASLLHQRIDGAVPTNPAIAPQILSCCNTLRNSMWRKFHGYHHFPEARDQHGRGDNRSSLKSFR